MFDIEFVENRFNDQITKLREEEMIETVTISKYEYEGLQNDVDGFKNLTNTLEQQNKNLLKTNAELSKEVQAIEIERSGYDAEIESMQYTVKETVETNYNLLKELNQLKRKTFSPAVSSLIKYRDNICSVAVREFGHTTQTFVAAEEMGELIQALSKDMRGQGNQKNILEEIVDVNIMLTQLILIYGIDKKQHDEMMYKKLDNLERKVVSLRLGKIQ